MRGFRGLLILLLVAVPLVWFAYRESQKGPVDPNGTHDKVFTVEAAKIDEIEIKSEAGERTTLRRNGTGWAIVQPVVTAPPDEAAVSGITSGLASLEVQRVIDESPADVTEFGLAAPKVEVGFKSGGQQHRLQLGQKTPSGTDVYARLADQKKVFLVSSFVESTFNKSTFDLQDKSVLKLDREKVDALSVTAGGPEMRFTKTNGEWVLAAPVEARAEYSMVDGLVARLGGLQMKSIAAAPESGIYGLDKPAATVRIGSGSSLATLVIGGAAADGTVYARDLARPAVFTIESALLDDLKKAPSEYRQKDLFDARSFNTSRLDIVRNGQTSSFAKTKAKDKDGKETETWRQTAPTARAVDGGTVEALISAATAARATSFAPPATRVATASPELVVALTFDDNKEERVTFVRTGAIAYAVRAGAQGAAVVEPAEIDSIVKALEAVK